MQRRTRTRVADTQASFAERLISAFVAVLFFAPMLVVLWLLGNDLLAWNTDQWLPGKVLLGAVAASALLGLTLPRAAATVFGWLAEVLLWFARLWTWPWR